MRVIQCTTPAEGHYRTIYSFPDDGVVHSHDRIAFALPNALRMHIAAAGTMHIDGVTFDDSINVSKGQDYEEVDGEDRWYLVINSRHVFFDHDDATESSIQGTTAHSGAPVTSSGELLNTTSCAQLLPPPPPPATPPPVQVYVPFITHRVTVGGALSDFNAQQYRKGLASLLPGVSPFDVRLAVSAGSVVVDAAIEVSAATASSMSAGDVLVDALAELTPDELSSATGTTILSIEAPVLAVHLATPSTTSRHTDDAHTDDAHLAQPPPPPASPPLPPPLPPSNTSSNTSSTTLFIFVISGAVLCLVLGGYCYHVLARQHKSRMVGSPTQRNDLAFRSRTLAKKPAARPAITPTPAAFMFAPLVNNGAGYQFQQIAETGIAWRC